MGKNTNDSIRMDGIIVDSNRDRFKVKLENDAIIIAQPAGKLRVHNIKLLEGDEVTVELSIYDLTKGRIIYRKK